MRTKTAHALNARRVGGEALAVFIGQGVGALGLLAAVRVLSSLLPPPDYGAFALGLTFVVLAAQLLFGPLANAALRYYAAAADRRQLGEFWAALGLLTAFASAAGVAIGLVAFAAAGTVGYRIPLLVAGSAIAFAILSGWEVVFDAVQSAQRQRWAVAWHQGLRTRTGSPWLSRDMRLRLAWCWYLRSYWPGARCGWWCARQHPTTYGGCSTSACHLQAGACLRGFS
jgi:hypothetical protein